MVKSRFSLYSPCELQCRYIYGRFFSEHEDACRFRLAAFWAESQLCLAASYITDSTTGCQLYNREYYRSTLIFTALHCAALYYTALCCIVLHCTVLHCTTLHCAALYYTALYCTVLHCTVLHCTTLHCAALHYTILHCTTLHCIAVQCTLESTTPSVL